MCFADFVPASHSKMKLTLRVFACITSIYVLFQSISRRRPVVHENSMSSTKSAILQSHANLLRELKSTSTTGFWIALILGLAVFSPSAVASGRAGTAQIQGGNLRIEFDSDLRTRVVARFDKTEMVMGPFTASETVTTADKLWTGFLQTSQKHERTKDSFGEGERLTAEGKSGTPTKIVSIPVYDDFPAMAFFDVQYTNTGTSKLDIKSWSNNAYTV